MVPKVPFPKHLDKPLLYNNEIWNSINVQSVIFLLPNTNTTRERIIVYIYLKLTLFLCTCL